METFKVLLNFVSVDEILWCDHSNETLSAVLSHGTICFVGSEKMKFAIFLEFLLWPLLGVKGINNQYYSILLSVKYECRRSFFKNRLTIFEKTFFFNLSI